MKRFGYALLLVGFGWICLQQFDGLMRGGLRPVVSAQYALLSPDPAKTYSREQMQTRIRETAIATHGLYPWVIAPGLLMLAGGLLLAHVGRNRPRRFRRTRD